MLTLSGRRDSHTADVFEDLASALEAGLDARSLGAHGDDPALLSALRARGVAPTAVEEAVLEAAAEAGRLPRALYDRARARRERVDHRHRLLGRLAYPVLVLALAAVVGLFTGFLTGAVLLHAVVALAGPAILIGLGLLYRHGITAREGTVHRLPVLGPVLRAQGEIPYLESLHGLYAAGIPLREAHPRAVAAVPVRAVRVRLQAADHTLQEGLPLGEGLARAGALLPETRSILTGAETHGDLEDALRRATERRRQQLTSGSQSLVHAVGALAYGLAVLSVAFVVLRFYGFYLSLLTL